MNPLVIANAARLFVLTKCNPRVARRAGFVVWPVREKGNDPAARRSQSSGLATLVMTIIQFATKICVIGRNFYSS